MPNHFCNNLFDKLIFRTKRMKQSKGKIQEDPIIKPEYIVCFGVGAALGAVVTLIIVVLIRGAG